MNEYRHFLTRQGNQAVTFDACDVPIPTTRFQQVPYRFFLESRMSGAIEAYNWRVPTVADISGLHDYFINGIESWYSVADCHITARLHPLVEAAHHAFASHFPLHLTPDHIWLTLCQGLAIHVNQNAEQLRHHFVQHEGKIEISVRRDEFIKGSIENDWEGVFGEFVAKIGDHIGSTADLISSKFSTTGIIEQAAFHITLMNMVKNYFELKVRSFCGIPRFIIEGTPQDWEDLLNRFQQFEKFELGWWVERVMPILEEFVHASKGQINQAFWNEIYKLGGGSGGTYINGWLPRLFPYIYRNGTYSVNEYMLDSNNRGTDLTTGVFPSGIATVPFKWELLTEECTMLFAAGFIGVSQDTETLALRPEIGWLVANGKAFEQMPQFGSSRESYFKKRKAHYETLIKA